VGIRNAGVQVWEIFWFNVAVKARSPSFSAGIYLVREGPHNRPSGLEPATPAARLEDNRRSSVSMTI
jgi:hypothetical protein